MVYNPFRSELTWHAAARSGMQQSILRCFEHSFQQEHELKACATG